MAVLEIRAAAAGARPDRISDRLDPRRTPSDHVCPRRVAGQAERVELLDPAARGIRARGIAGDDARATLLARFAASDAGAGRTWPHRRQPADAGALEVHARS